MATLLAETEEQLLSQQQTLHTSNAGLAYLRNKSELCAQHAKVSVCSVCVKQTTKRYVVWMLLQALLTGIAMASVSNFGYNPESTHHGEGRSELQSMLKRLIELAKASGLGSDENGNEQYWT